jgi:hypothetical protein
MLAVVCGLRLLLLRVVEAAGAVVVVGEGEEGSKRGGSRARMPLTVAGDGGAEGRRVATAGFIEAVVLSSMAMAMAGRGRGAGRAREARAAAGARRCDGGRGVGRCLAAESR